MAGALTGFAIIAVIIVLGYVLGRFRVLGDHAEYGLHRLAFFVLSPALMFTVLAEADVRHLLSNLLPISAIAAFVVLAVSLAVALVIWRRAMPEAVIGALGAGIVNANNIGIPVAVYVLGDATAPAPVLLLQVILLSPIALTILDVTTSGRPSLGRILTQPFRNPLIISSLLGVAVALTGIEVPEPVMEPIALIGAAAVPVILLTFGMSLHGARVLAPGPDRRDVIFASALKLILMPAVAWAAARFVFGLDGHELFVAVVLAALPSAQNTFNYAQRYGRGVVLARDTVLITTVLSLPVLMLISALLAA